MLENKNSRKFYLENAKQIYNSRIFWKMLKILEFYKMF